MSARSGKRLKTNIPYLGMQEDRSRKKLQRLFRRVARFNSRRYRHVDPPYRSRELARIALRSVALFPSEEARLMLPHIEGVGQHRLVLDPNDLLVNQDAAVTHRLLDFHLALRGVPNVDRSVGFTHSQCLPQECFVERAKRLILLLIGVPPFPILVLAVREILRGMVLRIVGDQIWRISRA